MGEKNAARVDIWMESCCRRCGRRGLLNIPVLKFSWFSEKGFG